MTEQISNTPFSNKCAILAELWMAYRDDVDFKDFIEYNDLGLPLAHAIASEYVEPKKIAIDFVNETFSMLLDSLNIPDSNFDSLDQMLSVASDGDTE